MIQFQSSPRDLARWQNAQQQLLQGQFGPALRDYLLLVRKFPGVAELWFELGNAASGELDFAQANQAYRSASLDRLLLPSEPRQILDYLYRLRSNCAKFSRAQ